MAGTGNKPHNNCCEQVLLAHGNAGASALLKTSGENSSNPKEMVQKAAAALGVGWAGQQTLQGWGVWSCFLFPQSSKSISKGSRAGDPAGIWEEKEQGLLFSPYTHTQGLSEPSQGKTNPQHLNLLVVKPTGPRFLSVKQTHSTSIPSV